MTYRGLSARRAAYWVLLALLLTAGGFLLFFNLDGAALSDCDEARHGVSAYEMLQSGDYVVTTFDGEPDYWNLKPPLSEYLILLGYQLFGFGATGLRFYSALSVMLMMLILSLWLKRRYGGVASLTALLVLLGCEWVYGHHFGRAGDADALMMLFYVIAMLFMLESGRDVRMLYGSAICFGLAFLSKSWHAAMIPATCFAYVCVTGQIRKLRVKNYLLLILLGVLLILPWAVARYLRDGWAFFEKMLMIDVAKRASTVLESHEGGPLYYVAFLLSSPAMVAGGALCLGALIWKLLGRRRLTKDQWGVLVWFAVPVVLYSLCVSKLAWYVYICAPALAVGFGMSCQRIASASPRVGKGLAARIACVTVASAALVYCAVGNWQAVSAQNVGDRYQRLLTEYFDRETDPGARIYIQYESENNYYEVDYRSWVQDDRLCAMFAGDLQCMNGGIDAFCEEEEHAYLICHDVGMDWDILGEYPLIYEDGPLMLVENLN
ncbi:MAG: glycosyltransferase family 39 protein [Clostridiales bacterium]|nr:glycosyltransferase family 39 protein [Clostridiales bacterium]